MTIFALLTLSGTELCCLLGSTNTSVESPEGNALLPLCDVVEVSVSLGELEAVDGGNNLCGRGK